MHEKLKGIRNKTCKLIECHGGIVVDQMECNTFQIMHNKAKIKLRDLYQGVVYREEWLLEAISAHQVKHADNLMMAGGAHTIKIKEDYVQIDQSRPNPKFKRLNIGAKKQFTILEGISLFKIMNTNKSEKLSRPDFWRGVADQHLIPERLPKQML